MTESNEWADALREANLSVKHLGFEIAVERGDGGTYHVLIIDRQNQKTTTFSEGNLADEVDDLVNEAAGHIRSGYVRSTVSQDEYRYIRVPGWTHDMPALIHSLTEFPLYFHDDQTQAIELVGDSIDEYGNRSGSFCLLDEDYKAACRQVEEHDRKIEEQLATIGIE